MTEQKSNDKETKEQVRVSNEEALEDNQAPTDEDAAEAVKVSNDEQYEDENKDEA